jgi:hypothetical protein
MASSKNLMNRYLFCSYLMDDDAHIIEGSHKLLISALGSLALVVWISLTMLSGLPANM